MKIVSFNDVSSDHWNACCAQSRQSWFFHSAEWVNIEEKYNQFKNLSFAVSDREKIVAVQPLYFISLGLGRWSEGLVCSGLHRHTGLACVKSLSDSNLVYAQTKALDHIHDISDKIGANRIQLNCQNLTEESLSLDRRHIPYWMFYKQKYYFGLNYSNNGLNPLVGKNVCCADQIVWLDDSVENLYNNLDPACRRAIKKATKENLECRICFGDNFQLKDVLLYHELALLSSKRTGEKPPSIEYLSELYSVFSRNKKIAIVFVEYESKATAAVLLAIEGRSTSYLGGVSNPDYLHFRINDFAHWNAILWCKSLGIEKYRLGPIFPEIDLSAPINKVARFKSRFGVRHVNILEGSHFITPDKYVDNMK